MDANKLFTKFAVEKIWNKLKQHDKAMNSILLILLPSNWVLQDGKYVNTVQYSGFKSSDKLTVDLYDDGNLADLQLTEYEHYIDGFEIIDGALVAIASVRPTQTMTVVVKGGFQANESEVGDLSVIEDELNVLGNRPVNNNILINSNFANPVNQRGVTAETWIPNRYGIDRWITDMTFSSITNGLTIGSLGTTGFLSQRFEEGLVEHGKKYSVSICIDGVIYNGTNTTDNSKGMVFVNNNIIKAYIDYSTDNDYWYLGLEFKTVGVTIEWVKLELGEHATPYVPRLYGEELELCKRYYQKIGGHSLDAGFLRVCHLESNSKTEKFGMFLLEKRMRVRPTVYFNKNAMDIWVTNGIVALTIAFNTLQVVALDTKSVHVHINHASHDYVAGGFFNFRNEYDYIAFDAEL